MEVVLIVALALSVVLLLLAVNTLWLCVVSAGVMQMKREAESQPVPQMPDISIQAVTSDGIEAFCRHYLPPGYSLSVSREEDQLRWSYSSPDEADFVRSCEGDLGDVIGEIQARHAGDDEHAS